MGIKDNIAKFNAALNPYGAKLIAVSKTHPVDKIREAYDSGQRIFGENKVQELTEKAPQLYQDIQWHLIGHLQRNKVKYIAPFVSLIHSVDSQKLLSEINQQGKKAGRVIHCLLQVFIANEETKFGLDHTELMQLITSAETAAMDHIIIDGLMGMATLTENKEQIREEFRSLKRTFEELKYQPLPENIRMKELSMGMSFDYSIALEEGSTMVRIGTAIFGTREIMKP
ncbi:MAG TPA: YggS family pyridoxal phosphate-dependent enzyme [Cyclobacteriaceae bacterium]|nr:YggS family pyridoxal phosphate-dependent enzyme [Cyclobacteriaceae bacterium]